jgi:eukaryotic-like serine/threonine-protein kinase
VILELPTLLAGRYEATQLLGAGSFAETYLATDQQEGQTVAVKVLRPHFASDGNTLIRFEREARATSEIVHPNVVRTLDYDTTGDPPFMVMEYVAGPDLKSLIQERGTFEPADATTIAVQILAGLDAIHQFGMIHRDVKPHNVLVDEEHGARLCDFSIVRALDQTGLTRTGVALGTASYMAPEQASGKEVTPAADLYATGIIMFEMLAGKVPFSGNDPLEVLYQQVHRDPPSLREINPAVPTWLESITLQAMSKNPEERFESANAMIHALSTGGGGEDATRQMDPALIAAQAATAAMPAAPSRKPPPPKRPSARAAVPPSPARPKRSRQWFQTPAILLVALLVVGLAVGAIYAFGTGDEPLDDEPSTIVDEPGDDGAPEEDLDSAAPTEDEEPPAETEPPQEPDVQDPPPEETEPAPEVETPPVEEEPAPEPEGEQEAPVEDEPEPADEVEQEEANNDGNQGNPPDHAGGDRGEERSQRDDNPGQGNN